jgi:hypothetical protein
MLLFEEELWNGFGPRMHRRHSGYLWAGTNIYDGGKYVSDSVWDPKAMDRQLGTVPLMRALVALDPSLDIEGHPMLDPKPLVEAPVGHDDISIHNVLWVQESLNKLQDDHLRLDGSWGKHTARAVRIFQKAHGLHIDGVPGDDTKTALVAALAE